MSYVVDMLFYSYVSYTLKFFTPKVIVSLVLVDEINFKCDKDRYKGKCDENSHKGLKKKRFYEIKYLKNFTCKQFFKIVNDITVCK